MKSESSREIVVIAGSRTEPEPRKDEVTSIIRVFQISESRNPVTNININILSLALSFSFLFCCAHPPFQWSSSSKSGSFSDSWTLEENSESRPLIADTFRSVDVDVTSVNPHWRSWLT